MIDYIACENGAIEMFEGDNLVAVAETAKSIAYFMQEFGVASSVYTSSSIDFASEYGFENDEDAIDLWEAGLKMFQMAGGEAA